ncbi:MFS transporter [Paenibacillus sp. JSM ZJ436]|uniref:MFS transporter n=1 Tax=Paenibacillus sp. JSM ZJ436 TaxID=3376190 RepID=UPI0037967870
MQAEWKQPGAESAVRSSASSASLWHNRPFLLLLSGYSLSVFGNGFQSIALSLWILETTGSARMMSLVMGIYMLSSLLFGVVAGTVSDRSNRIRLMTAADLLRALCTAGIALVIGLAPQLTFAVLILVGMTAVSGLFHSPSMQTSLVRFAGQDQIQRSTSLVNIMENIARVSGLALGGVVITWFGGVAAIWVDSFTFLLSAMLISQAGAYIAARERQGIRAGEGEELAAPPDPVQESLNCKSHPPRKKLLSEMWSGLQFMKNDAAARAVMILSPSLMLFFTSCLMLIQVVAVKVWKVNPAGFGLIEAAFPVGYLTGSFLILTLDQRLRRRGWLIFAGIFSLGPVFVLMTFSRSLVFSVLLIFAAGFMFAFATLLVQILLRLRVQPDMLGRAFGILGSLTSVLPPAGLALSAFAADLYGPAPTLLIIGLLLSVLGILSFAGLKPIRDFD